MPGDADVADQALVLGADGRLDGAAVAVHLAQLVEVADRVQLQQVDVVGLQPLQRPVDRRPGTLAVAVAGLRGQEDLVTDPGHPGAQPQLGVAVARGHVEVVDPGVQGLLDRGVGGRLVDLGQRRRAVDQHRALVPEPPQPAVLHVRPLSCRRALPCLLLARSATYGGPSRSAAPHGARRAAPSSRAPCGRSRVAGFSVTTGGSWSRMTSLDVFVLLLIPWTVTQPGLSVVGSSVCAMGDGGRDEQEPLDADGTELPTASTSRTRA